jgi:large subunit ribosomal protein L24
MPPTRENEAPIPLANLRLVVPYATTSYSSEGAQAITSAQDVVVDKIYMERHTTGIDPFTGTDYGDAEIPAKHQYDPQTGLPIFHRYIAGTRHRIEWPWETEKTARNSNKAPKKKTEHQTWLGKTLSTLRHPITTLQRLTGTSSNSSAPRIVEPESDEPLLTQLETVEAKRQQKLRAKPRTKAEKTDAYEIDTTRNIVEGAESMSYTLVAPPFPETLGAELRGDIHDFAIAARKDQDNPYNAIRPSRSTPQQQAALELLKQKREAALKMKTPMQVRWEAEQAKKKATAPAVNTDMLLQALGKHMIKSKMEMKARRKPAKAVKAAKADAPVEPAKAEELD